MSSVVTTRDASLSSFSSASNRKKKQNSFISRLLSRIVSPLILVLFVSDVLFYETEETKLRSVAKREETRVGSHKIDHGQYYHRHQNEYNNEVFVRDGKPEEIAEIHDATKTSDDDAGDEGGGGAEKRSSGSRSSSSSNGTSMSGGGSSFDGVNNNNEDNSMGGSISGKAMMDGERCVASIRDG